MLKHNKKTKKVEIEESEIKDLVCENCGLVGAHKTSQQFDSINRLHIRCECGDCGKFIKFVKQKEKKHIGRDGKEYHPLFFGKYKGKCAEDIQDVNYIVWAVDNDVFDKNIRIVFENRLNELGHQKEFLDNSEMPSKEYRIMSFEEYQKRKSEGTLPETTNKSTVWKD